MEINLAEYLRFAAALGLVLAMIGGLAVVARKYGLGNRLPMVKGRKRLAISEVIALDPKRRLVLVKRDNVEHLLVIGGEADLVVERNIDPPADVTEALSGLAKGEGDKPGHA